MAMTTTSAVNRGLEEKQKVLRWSFARSHPVLAFLLITFAWSWLIWFATIPLAEQDRPLVAMITMVGAFGPALGGILTLGLKQGLSLQLTGKQAGVMAVTSLLILALLAVRSLTGGTTHYDGLPENVTFTAPLLAAAALTCLVGGWVVAGARSANPDVRERMASLLPVGQPLKWTIFAFLFFPTMLLLSWGAGALLGLGVEYPAVLQHSAPEVIGLFVLAHLITALIGGGLEEPGWRGMLLPEMQKKYNPLVASLFVSLVWSLWHLPLYLNGFYSGDIVGGMIGSGIYRILLAIFMTWFYNRSGGSLFLLVVLHTSFNMTVNFLPLSDLGMLVLWLGVVAVVVVKDKMLRKLA